MLDDFRRQCLLKIVSSKRHIHSVHVNLAEIDSMLVCCKRKQFNNFMLRIRTIKIMLAPSFEKKIAAREIM